MTSSIPASAIVVGAGPAGLAAAEVLAEAGVSVTIHERMPSPARKFLLAGRGGLNLTHSEPLEDFLGRYGEARGHLEPAIRAFDPAMLRQWCEALGVETFVGSSGRVFPKAMKASPLLRVWLRRLDGMGVKLVTRSRFVGWRGDDLVFERDGAEETHTADGAVFALGGASWPRLGSDGSWQAAFAARGASIVPLRPANSGFLANWSDIFRTKFAGQPLKPAAFSFEGETLRGEAIITRDGLEGGAIYALSSKLRAAIERDGHALLEIDLAPNTDADPFTRKLQAHWKESVANRLRKAGLSPLAVNLMREGAGARGLSPQLTSDADALTQLAKACPIRLTATTDIARAISTAGGISWDSVNADFSLKSDPRTFVCGEMLDWEAPTGGYLLQGCFSTGRAAATGVLANFNR